MNFLTQLRISQRLAVSYGLLILLLIAIGSYGANTASRLAKDLDLTANSSLVKIASANALEEQVNVIARASRDLLLLDEARQIKKQKAAIEAALAESDKQINDVEASLVGDKEKDLVRQVRERKTAFVGAVAKFQKIQKDGSPDEARESLITDVRPAQQAYQDGLKALVDLQFNRARDVAVSGGETARTSVLVFDIKVLLLLMVFVYAFFRFTWSMRQYTFGALLVGSAPEAKQFLEFNLSREAFADKAGRVMGFAAETFNDGLRAYYFSFAVVGWFMSPVVFMLATALVVWILYQREFHSDVLSALNA